MSTALPEVVVVLTTVPVGDLGETVARALVEERLAACVNVCAPMTSVYRWDGRVTHDLERQIVVKTTVDRIDAIRERLARLHPYELPEFLVCPVRDGSDAYLAWVRSETAPTADP
jgi:periplasmic divalent cation tolerance protein